MARTQAAAEVDTAVIDVTALVSAMKERFDALPERPRQQPYTFSRVPAYFRKTDKRLNERLYEPTVISIGPYHHGSSHLQAMEKHKWRYLLEFLSHSRTGATLDGCLKKMKVWEEEARRCYSESISLTSDEFVEMLLLDAGFIIELAFKLYNEKKNMFWRRRSESECSGLEFHLGWGLENLHLDLLLIENQIPFFIIQRLFDLVDSTAEISNPSFLIEKLILRLYSMASTLEKPRPLPQLPTEIHHLLHLYHHIFVASLQPNIKESRWLPIETLFGVLFFPLKRYICLLFGLIFGGRVGGFFIRFSSYYEMSGSSAYFIPCATELQEAGVRFKRKRVGSHLLDITFRGGVMEMPVFLIDYTTKPLFTNLIAFEQLACSNTYKRNMTSFCRLMDCLVNTEKDVAILQRSDVIENYLGSEEEVACSLNQLGSYSSSYSSYGVRHYFSEMFKQVNWYRSSSWHKHRARFCNDYFGNPWAFLSLLAALVLLALTFLQTFFATYTYFRH